MASQPVQPAQLPIARPRVPVQGGGVAARNPRDHAIVVGIDHYRPDIPTLHGAINDCTLFCRWLVDPAGGGLDAANVTFCASTDPTDLQPNRAQIENLLLEFFRHKFKTGQKVGRRLYLFLAGHGAGNQSETHQWGLVMADGEPEVLRTLIGEKAAERVRTAGLFEEVMLVMDCCRQSDGAVAAGCDLPGPDPTLPPAPYLHIVTKPGSTASEFLLPDPFNPAGGQSQQGAVTHALLRGLQTAIDENGDINAASLKKCVRQAVAKLLGNTASTPPRIDYDEDLPLMTFGKSEGVPVEVSLRPGTADFRIIRGLDFSEATPRRLAQVGGFRVCLPPAMYLFEGLDAAGARTSSVPLKVADGESHVTV